MGQTVSSKVGRLAGLGLIEARKRQAKLFGDIAFYGRWTLPLLLPSRIHAISRQGAPAEDQPCKDAMNYLLTGAWLLVKVLSYGGIVIAILGVGIFGFHFVRVNARAARTETDEIPRESWRGAPARMGLKIFVLGAVLQLASLLLSATLPQRF